MNTWEQSCMMDFPLRGEGCKGCAAVLPRTVGIIQQRSRHGTTANYKYQCPLPILVLGFGYTYLFRLYIWFREQNILHFYFLALLF